MRLKQKALTKAKDEDNSESTNDWLRGWWCNKYKLPINDPRLLSRTPGSLFAEVLEDCHKRREDLIQQTQTASVTEVNKIIEAIQALDKFLGSATSDKPVFTGDPIIDAWEEALARGEIPESLTKGIVQPRKSVDTQPVKLKGSR